MTPSHLARPGIDVKLEGGAYVMLGGATTSITQSKVVQFPLAFVPQNVM